MDILVLLGCSKPHFLGRRSAKSTQSANTSKVLNPPVKTKLLVTFGFLSLMVRSQMMVYRDGTLTKWAALELAEEYGILPWITALLDRSDIAEVKNPEDPTKSISPPPKFLFTANDKGFFSPPHSAPRGATPRARGRPRASSPIKNGTPAHKAGTARKPRATKSSHAANAATARDVSASLQATLDRAASIADSESVEGEKAATGGESVLVEVESAVEVNGDLETTSTNVKIEMPSGSAELPLPENPEQMIKTAKVMVNEARRLNGDTSNSSQRLKRKVEELDDDDDDEANERESPPTKRTRLVEQQVTREGMGKRTIIGVTAAIALGYVWSLS